MSESQVDKMRCQCDGGPLDGKEVLVPRRPIGEWYAFKVSDGKFLVYGSRFSAAPDGLARLVFHDSNGVNAWNDFAPVDEVKRLNPTIVNFLNQD